MPSHRNRRQLWKKMNNGLVSRFRPRGTEKEMETGAEISPQPAFMHDGLLEPPEGVPTALPPRRGKTDAKFSD